MRLIHTFHKSSGITAKVFFSEEYEEFTVRFYVGKDHLPNMDNVTDNREEALNDARVLLSEMDMITE
jgi:hypothetical protein